MLCIERSNQGITTRQLKGNQYVACYDERWSTTYRVDDKQRQYVFPIVDNGGRIIGGYIFLHYHHLLRQNNMSKNTFCLIRCNVLC